MKTILNQIQRIKLLGLAVSVALLCYPALATVSYQIGNGGLESFNVSIDGTTYNGALAGGIAIHKTAGDISAPVDYISLCTDIQGTLYLGSTYIYDMPASFGSLSGVNPKWGVGNVGQKVNNSSSAHEAIQNAAELFYTHYSVLSPISGPITQLMITDRAALQLAVWAALYNTDASGHIITGTGSRFSFSGGDANAISEANDWLGKLTTATYNGNILVPNPIDGQQKYGNPEPPQELLIYVEPLTGAPPVSVVPESSTMVAGILLLLPLGAGLLRAVRVA